MKERQLRQTLIKIKPGRRNVNRALFFSIQRFAEQLQDSALPHKGKAAGPHPLTFHFDVNQSMRE
jgi:hypothetical protein